MDGEGPPFFFSTLATGVGAGAGVEAKAARRFGRIGQHRLDTAAACEQRRQVLRLGAQPALRLRAGRGTNVGTDVGIGIGIANELKNRGIIV